MLEEFQRARWTERTLEQRPKGDAKKVQIAQQLRQETAMSLDWIAGLLRLGTKTHLGQLLYWGKGIERRVIKTRTLLWLTEWIASQGVDPSRAKKQLARVKSLRGPHSAR